MSLSKLINKLVIPISILVITAASAPRVYAEAAIEPVVAVGGASGGNCALLQVPAGQFNAGGNLAIDISTPGGQAILATSLLAFSLGKSVYVDRRTQAAGCYGIADYAVDVRISN